MHCNPDYDTHVMPADVTMNAVIILGAERINAGLDGKALFCNISSDYVNPIAWGKSVQVCWEKVIQNPLCFSGRLDQVQLRSPHDLCDPVPLLAGLSDRLLACCVPERTIVGRSQLVFIIPNKNSTFQLGQSAEEDRPGLEHAAVLHHQAVGVQKRPNVRNV